MTDSLIITQHTRRRQLLPLPPPSSPPPLPAAAPRPEAASAAARPRSNLIRAHVDERPRMGGSSFWMMPVVFTCQCSRNRSKGKETNKQPKQNVLSRSVRSGGVTVPTEVPKLARARARPFSSSGRRSQRHVRSRVDRLDRSIDTRAALLEVGAVLFL